jgi:hypothetical protein
MKNLVSSILLAGALAWLAIPALAADSQVTITGKGECAKCALKESDHCQNVIETTQNGKTVKYYLVQNDLSKDFHENLCKKSAEVKATGTVHEEHGKMMLTVSKIELVK